MMMNVDEFKLDDTDTALVIKQDMTTEMYLPKLDDNDAVSTEDNQNVYITMAIMLAMNDDDFRALIQKKINIIFQSLDTEEADNVDPDPSPCPGCPGCAGSYTPETPEEE